MPLISIEPIDTATRLGLWRIDESIDGFQEADSRLIPIADLVAHHRSSHRQLEIMAVYALLFSMTGDPELRIAHDEQSRPLLKGYNISISHTRGFAALLLSTDANVAVDIEYMSDRVKKVAAKFVRPDEQAPDLRSLLIHWCAKETVYKLFTLEDLQYFEMRVRPFDAERVGMLTVDDLKTDTAAAVAYRVTDDYVLAYALS